MSLWRTLALLVLVGFAWILPQECLGQTAPTQIDSNTTTGPTPYGSFGGVHENINLGTGDLTLQVPLLTLPGRNGFDLSVGLTYDSKVWVLNYMVDPNNPDLWDYWWDAEDRQPAIEGWSGGWRLNLPTLQAINYDLGAGDGFSNRNCFEFFIATLPDGRQAQFLNKAACSHTSSISHQTTADPASNLPVSESQEGSFLRLDTTNPADIVLYEKNGTRYHFSTGWVLDGPGVSSPQYYPASSMIDANGNTVTITSTVDSFPAPIFINSIKDSLGRTVTFTYSSAETLTSISYKDSNGTSRTISFGYSQLPLNYTFANPPNSGTFLPSNYIVPRLTSITLPNGLGYTFGYNSALAELNKITYPTGGYTRYDTGTFTYLWRTGRPPTLAKVPNPQAADYREITARHVCRLAAGNCTTSTEDTTTYTPTIDGNKSNNLYMDVVGPPDTNAPSGNKTRHQFPYQTSSDGIPLSFANIAFAPRETNTTIYQGLTTALRTIKTDFNQLDSAGRPQSISFPIRVTTTLNDSNTIMKTEWDYDTYTPPESGTATPIDNVTEERDFDYGVPGSGTFGPLRRRTDRAWVKTNSVNGSDYTSTAIHILNRKASEIVYDSTANTCNGQTRVCSQTNYEYDNFTLGISASGAVQHNSTFSTTYKTRGNLTATMRWRNTDGATLTTRNQYDDAGNMTQTTDPLSHTTTFSHADSWGNTSCLPSGGSAAAYLTKATDALGHFSRKTYNTCTGTIASATDLNSQETTLTYDLMGRITQTNFPDGGQTTKCYSDISGTSCHSASKPLTIVTTTKVTSAISVKDTEIIDGLGRETQHQLNSDPTGVDYTDTTYDAVGRKATGSNPYRSTSDPTYGVTTYEYDALNRVTLVIPPDGTATSNNVTTQYCGGTTLVTDQAGHWRRSTTDALSRITELDEPNSMTATVNVCPGTGEPTWVTTYGYDALNNLLSASQGASRQRSFVFDSLAELTSSMNPEAGTVTYTYNNDGIMLTRKDARTFTTTYSYDSVHRMTGKTYSNGDPSVGYTYDQTACLGQTSCYNIGRRTTMTDAAGSEAFAYDNMGRPVTEQRTSNSVSKNTTYTYNFDGSVAILTYPSGRAINYTPDAAGRPLSAVDTTNSINYATATTYAPQGALATAILGANGIFSGVNLGDSYNSRLQPNEFKASSTAGTALDLTYSFVDGSSHNNGNVIAVTNNKDTTRSQNFTYDQVNRLLTAKTTSTSGPNCWGLNFGYDQWSNLSSAAVSQCSAYTLSLTISSTNQVTNTGYSYDASGNLLGDGSFQYVWNAESEIKTAAGVNYTYDGDGNRVEKSSGKIYWYGAGSQILDESDLSGNITDEYVFFGGKRIAHRDSGGNIYYYAEDFLGSSRVITTATGTTCYDADFYPFGGERVVINSCAQNYKFTGKERDTETFNDNFGARYYSSNSGRFLSPDWSVVPAPIPYADLTNPQTLNLYQFVKNDPETIVDGDGHLGPGQTGSSEGMFIMPQMRPGGSIDGGGPWTDSVTEMGLSGVVFDSETAWGTIGADGDGNGTNAQTQQSNQQSTDGTPTGIKTTVSKQQNLNGDQLSFPGGGYSADKLYGFAVGVAYTVVDASGKQLNFPGMTLTEKVVLGPYNPAAAKPLVEGLQQTREKVSPDKHGRFTDIVGPASTMKSNAAKWARLPDFEAHYNQTLTVTLPRGQTLTTHNQITINNYGVSVKPIP